MRYERFRSMNARAPGQVINPTDYRAGASAASDHWVYISSRDRVTFATMAQVAGESAEARRRRPGTSDAAVCRLVRLDSRCGLLGRTRPCRFLIGPHHEHGARGVIKQGR
jgi:hypothetical protein